MKERPEGAAICIRGLTKRYPDGTLANKEIDLDVCEGEVLAILGPNGAGKTTLVRQITAELSPTAGSVRVRGLDPFVEPLKAKKLLGIIPQEASLFSHLTVQDHLFFFGRLKGLSRKVARAQVDRLIQILSLEDYRWKKVKTLSGGTGRKVFIGLALLGDPPILILDEPTAGLDPAARRDVRRLINEVKAWGRTVVLTTHYLEEAEYLSDRIGILQGGALKRLGTLEDLYRSVPKSYRLIYYEEDETSRGKRKRTIVRDEADFGAVKKIIEKRGLEEYSIRRISLEDIYLELTAEQKQESD
ncbi:MAG: ABC transporter ATP-binding protein [Deltaproteobacteria bacterium]|nr:ABC transporter ATP-binding protein [Deltaproteobacteria bacterium]